MSVASKRENPLMDEVKILQRLKHPGVGSSSFLQSHSVDCQH